MRIMSTAQALAITQATTIIRVPIALTHTQDMTVMTVVKVRTSQTGPGVTVATLTLAHPTAGTMKKTVTVNTLTLTDTMAMNTSATIITMVITATNIILPEISMIHTMIARQRTTYAIQTAKGLVAGGIPTTGTTEQRTMLEALQTTGQAI